MCPCNDQNFKSVVWNIKIFCTNNFFVTVNEYYKRITLYTYKILFQLHWPSCIESESPDGISYSGSHQIEKEIFLLLTIDYLSKSDWEVRSLLFLPRNTNSPFLFGNRGIWVKCVLYWLICNVELDIYKKFYYWEAEKWWWWCL